VEWMHHLVVECKVEISKAVECHLVENSRR